jgi:tetratricopeptide (TPR) repeat protein
MLNRLSFLVAVIALTCADGSSAGNFPLDFQEAVRLYHTPGTAADAEAAFLELAARKIRHSRGTDAALEMASLCALRRQDFEEAEQRADRIQEESLRILCRMRIWEAQRRWADIVDGLGKQNIETWPDRLIYDAAMCRGKAYAIQRNAAAEKDFQLALAYTIDARELAFANLALGNFYRDQARDEDKAFAAYRKVAESSVRGAPKYESVIAYAMLLAARDKGREALEQLDGLKVETIPHPDWRCRIHQAYGDLHAALNRPADAMAAYRKAINVPGASAYLVQAIEKKTAEMAP